VMTCSHTREQIDHLLGSLREIKSELGS
jgi:hypothetical protein